MLYISTYAYEYLYFIFEISLGVWVPIRYINLPTSVGLLSIISLTSYWVFLLKTLMSNLPIVFCSPGTVRSTEVASKVRAFDLRQSYNAVRFFDVAATLRSTLNTMWWEDKVMSLCLTKYCDMKMYPVLN